MDYAPDTLAKPSPAIRKPPPRTEFQQAMRVLWISLVVMAVLFIIAVIYSARESLLDFVFTT